MKMALVTRRGKNSGKNKEVTSLVMEYLKSQPSASSAILPPAITPMPGFHHFAFLYPKWTKAAQFQMTYSFTLKGSFAPMNSN